jgi:thiol-disulfide isomerase/thioredoxin
VIYLYFYATWCPICAAERPNVLAAFDELSDPRAVGFEVHYKDDQSNAEDAEAARLFGIPYQHTVVILAPDGTEAYRSLEPISKDTIKSEIAKAEG